MNKTRSLLLGMALALAGCNWQVSAIGGATPTAFIITSTLPPTPVPSATLTPIPPTPSPTTAPLEGMTTTQINVRGEPSTTAEQIAVLAPFLKVQIIGKDADGKWYAILYPQGPGGVAWVTADYINVKSKDAIPVIGGGIAPPAPTDLTGTPPGSGTIMQQVNVRKGPGTSFETLGTLNAKATAKVTGKDPSGSWLQIEYADASDGKGWIAAAYIKADGLASLPIIGGVAAAAATPSRSATPPSPNPGIAVADNDSAEAPAANAVFAPSGIRALIYSSDLSAPDGDLQDFVGFTPYGSEVTLSLGCSGTAQMETELELHGAPVANWDGLACDETKIVGLQPAQPYTIGISVIATGETRVFVQYTIRIDESG